MEVQSDSAAGRPAARPRNGGATAPGNAQEAIGVWRMAQRHSRAARAGPRPRHCPPANPATHPSRWDGGPAPLEDGLAACSIGEGQAWRGRCAGAGGVDGARPRWCSCPPPLPTTPIPTPLPFPRLSLPAPAVPGPGRASVHLRCGVGCARARRRRPARRCRPVLLHLARAERGGRLGRRTAGDGRRRPAPAPHCPPPCPPSNPLPSSLRTWYLAVAYFVAAFGASAATAD